MLGAIAGDIIGSNYEFIDMRDYNFDLLPSGSHFTDDTVMTIAVALWVTGHEGEERTKEQLIECSRVWDGHIPMQVMAVPSTVGYGVRIRNPTIAGATEPQCVSAR